MSKRLAVVVGVATAALAAVAVSATPAMAAPTGSTTVTFAISGGALNIVVPASKDLGSGAAAGTVSGQLGTVTVTDQRSALLASWTTTATSTAFTTGTATADETIPAGAVNYAPGLATNVTGIGVPVPGLGGAMSAPVTAMTKLVGAGNNSVSWNPTLTINVPAAAVAGTYTGTITHSVA